MATLPVPGTVLIVTTSYSISDLRGRLALLDDKIAAAERAVEDAQRKLMSARTERAGAEAFINLLEASTEPDQPSAETGRSVNGDGISSIVLAILQAHPEGVRLDDVPRLAAEQGGPALEPQQVRSAVKYLGRRGDAENIRRGLWRPKTDASTNADGPAEAGPSDVTSLPVPAEVNAG